MRPLFVVLIVFVLGIFTSSPAVASKRVALVIGNSDYEFAGTLKNPANDAEDMNAALKQLGFEVIYDVDLEKPQLEAKLHEFAKALSGADVGLFFYAGHGLQVDGRNYIMPTDAELTDGEHMLPYELVELSKIQKTMEAATKTNIILLDACRNNPLARNLKKALGTRSSAVANGLAKVEAGRGTLISYATHPGAVAADGRGRNSPYTAALKKHILTPGEDLNSILIDVRRDVVAATNGAQVPWDQHALLENIYLGGKIEIPEVAGGDAGYRARLKKQIETSTSVAELDTLGRLEPAFGPLIEARKKQLAFLRKREEQARKDEAARKREPALVVKPGSGKSFKDKLANGDPCEFCPEMVVVPAGKFLMGSPKGEPLRDEDEGPQREVRIAKPFAVGKFEVTVGLFKAFVGEGGYSPEEKCYHVIGEKSVEKSGGFLKPGFSQNESHPAVCVFWRDAKSFAIWLSEKTGRNYRLLSEAEWEYAARAGTTGQWSFPGGEERLCTYANHMDRSGTSPWKNDACSDGVGAGSSEVGRYRANPWGLHDVHGNAAEWVRDDWHRNYEGAPIDGSAWIYKPEDITPEMRRDLEKRILRGGSWADGDIGIRVADRERFYSSLTMNFVGFRIARDLEP